MATITLQNLTRVLTGVTNWRSLGLQLKINRHFLEGFGEEYQNDQERLAVMLHFWLSNDPTASWETLIAALRSIDLNRVAEIIEKEYTTTSSIPLKSQATALADMLDALKEGVESQDVLRYGLDSHKLGKSLIQCEPQASPPYPISSTLLQSVSSDTSSKKSSLNEVRVRKIRGEIVELEERFHSLENMCLRELSSDPSVNLYEYVEDLLGYDKAQVHKEKNAERSFSVLSKYWNFLNPTLLEYVILGSTQDQLLRRALENYVVQLQQFRFRTTLANFVAAWSRDGDICPPIANYSEVVTNTGEMTTLENVDLFRRRFTHWTTSSMFTFQWKLRIKNISRALRQRIVSLKYPYLLFNISMGDDEILLSWRAPNHASCRLIDSLIRSDFKLIRIVGLEQSDLLLLILQSAKIRQALTMRIKELIRTEQQFKNQVKHFEQEAEMQLQLRSSLVPVSNYNLPGVNVIDRMLITVPGSTQLQTFSWENFGLKFHLPQGALPEGHASEILVSAASTGHFDFPQETTPVSHVYYIHSSARFSTEVTLELEHCCAFDEESAGALTFAIADTSDKQKQSYSFQWLHGGKFTPSSSYGSISVSKFSLFTILWNSIRGRRPPTIECFGYVYCKREAKHTWKLTLVVTRRLRASCQAVEKKYSSLKELTSFPLQFDGTSGHVSLDIGRSITTSDQCWKIYPLFSTMISKQEVLNVRSHGSPPKCELTLRWLKEDEDPKFLEHTVKLQGAKPPRDFFTITLDPSEGNLTVSTQEVKVQKYRTDKPKLTDLMLFQAAGKRINIPQEVGTNYKTFGTFLLQDDNGKIIDGITHDCGADTLMTNISILQKWLQGIGKGPHTWDTLVLCLRFANLITIADDIDGSLT